MSPDHFKYFWYEDRYTGLGTICSEPTNAGATGRWRSVVYGNELFVAVSQDGEVMRFSDGVNWTIGLAAEANSWHSVTYGGGLFVAVFIDGDPFLFRNVLRGSHASPALPSWRSRHRRPPCRRPIFVQKRTSGIPRVACFALLAQSTSPASLPATHFCSETYFGDPTRRLLCPPGAVDIAGLLAGDPFLFRNVLQGSHPRYGWVLTWRGFLHFGGGELNRLGSPGDGGKDYHKK